MYIRKNVRKHKDKTYTNYMLVESVHTPKGPRQRTICSLGDLRPRPRSEWLKLAHKVERALAGQLEIFDRDDSEVAQIVGKVRAREAARFGSKAQKSRGPQQVAIDTDRVSTEEHREAGPVHVGYQFYQLLNVDNILKDAGISKRGRVLSCAMVLARLIYPCSELAMPKWIRQTALSDILGEDFQELEENALYRNMDRLYPKRAKIEAALVERERSLFNLDTTIYLYDLTSTYFEGHAAGNPKAKRGYSRDKRPDCKQVVVGLVINRDGFPIAHEIFEGNLQDRMSVDKILDVLDNRVGLAKGATVVVDRGMAYADNLEQLRARGLHYIVASRQSERDQWLSEFEQQQGFEELIRTPSPNNPYQKKTRVVVKKKSTADHDFVLCISEGREQKDRAIREKQEQKLVTDLEKLARRIEAGRLMSAGKIGEAIGRLKERYPRVARYYQINYNEKSIQFTYEVDEQRRDKAEQLDGSYMLKTSRKDLSAEEAWRIYMLLTRAENAFRSMKSPLAERPIFHQIERRTDTHIFLCILAYHLLVAIEKRLHDKGVHTSWATVRDTLKTHQVCTVVLPAKDGWTLRIRKASTPEPEHRKLYDLLDIPSEVIRPRRAWLL